MLRRRQTFFDPAGETSLQIQCSCFHLIRNASKHSHGVGTAVITVTRIQAAQLVNHGSVPSTGKRLFSVLKHPEQFQNPPSCYSVGTGGSFLRSKADRARSWSTACGATTKKESSYNCTPSCASTLCTVTTLHSHVTTQLTNKNTKTSTIPDTNEATFWVFSTAVTVKITHPWSHSPLNHSPLSSLTWLLPLPLILAISFSWLVGWVNVQGEMKALPCWL
jgi:hypothetical protein